MRVGCPPWIGVKTGICKNFPIHGSKPFGARRHQGLFWGGVDRLRLFSARSEPVAATHAALRLTPVASRACASETTNI